MEDLATSSRSRLLRLALVVASLVVVVAGDRLTKSLAAAHLVPGAPPLSVVGDSVVFIYAENDGAFLSLGADWSPAVRLAVFTVLSTAVLVFFLVYILRSRSLGTGSAIAVGLFLGGGAGNLIDRFARGRVIDFLNVGIGPVRTGIFNVADFSMLLGLAILAFSQLGRKVPS